MDQQFTVVVYHQGVATLHHYYVASAGVALAMARFSVPHDARMLGVLPYCQEFVPHAAE